MNDQERDEFELLQWQVLHLTRTVRTLIAWMAQSANTPISRTEADLLFRILDGMTDDAGDADDDDGV